MFKRSVFALVIALCPLLAAAQSTTDTIQQEIKELQRRIDILTKEIENIKSGEEKAAPAADVQQYGLGAAASKVYRAQPGISFGGYGEMLYQNLARENDRGDRIGPEDTADFLRGILYTGYKFNDRVLFNSEIEFEHGSTEEGGAVSVEFGYLDFLARPDFGVRAGMVLIPVGLINEQHEPTAFLGARRPLVERSIIPSTWSEMGAGVFGEVGQLTYRGYVVNGLKSSRFNAEDGIREGRGKGAEAQAESFAVTGRLDWQPIIGTTVGASLYAGNSGQGAVDESGEEFDGRVTLGDIHVDSKFRGLSLRGLWARGTLGDAATINAINGFTGESSVGKSFGGWYAEAGYDLATLRPVGQASLIPFVRHERFNTQRSVPSGFSRDRGLENRIWTVGFSLKPISQTVIKVDYQNVDTPTDSGVDQFNVAIGYIF